MTIKKKVARMRKQTYVYGMVANCIRCGTGLAFNMEKYRIKGKELEREEAKVDRYDPTMFENPEFKMGGFGGERTVTLPLNDILTRDEKKDKRLMEKIWRHGDIAEFAARYHAKGLDMALDWFYRKVLIKLRMITPTSFTSSKVELLKPIHHTILARIEKEKQEEKKLNDAYNEVVNPSAAGGLRQELAAT